jgi:hypothetical protein
MTPLQAQLLKLSAYLAKYHKAAAGFVTTVITIATALAASQLLPVAYSTKIGVLILAATPLLNALGIAKSRANAQTSPGTVPEVISVDKNQAGVVDVGNVVVFAIVVLVVLFVWFAFIAQHVR